MKTNTKFKLLILVLLFTIILMLFSGCTKEPIGQYELAEPVVDTSHWQNDYSNGGTLPTWGTGSNPNQIFGTNWVLTDVYTNYAHINKNDTVHFVSNTNYTVGSDTTKYTYYLTSTMGNSTMQLNTFIPINGLTLSCTNFWGGVFTSTPIGGTIQLLLKDVFSSTTYTSTFQKI